MVERALVISGAKPFYQPSITRFAAVHLQVQNPDIVFAPSVDQKQYQVSHMRELARKRFALREMIEFKVNKIFDPKGRSFDGTCLIVFKVQFCRYSSEFPKCMDFVLTECAHMAGWGLFAKVCAACCAPNHELVWIDP